MVMITGDYKSLSMTEYLWLSVTFHNRNSNTWRKLGSLATKWAHSEDSDLTGRMPRLIWDFAGRTLILFVLSRGGSDNDFDG